MINFKIQDNRNKIIEELEKRKTAILESIGLTAVDYATMATPTVTGEAKDSITHTVSGDKVYVGSNLSYFVYLEVGTGIHATDGNGRRGYWVYVPGQKYERKGDKKIYTLQQAIALAEMLRKEGLDARVTNGIEPKHIIRNSISEHMDDYKKIVAEELKNMKF